MALAVQFDLPKGARDFAYDSWRETKAAISQTLDQTSQVAAAAFSNGAKIVSESSAISSGIHSVWSSFVKALASSLRTVTNAIPGEAISYSRESRSQGAAASLALAGQNPQPTFVTATTSVQRVVNVGTTTVVNNYITQPVIERVVEHAAQGQGSIDSGAAGYVTQSELLSQIAALKNSFGTQLYGTTYPTPATNYGSGGVVNMIALSNKIDTLSGTKLSSITVNGVSGLTDADIPDSLTASNYLPLAGGTLTGTLTGTSLTLSGNLTVSGTQTLSGAITIPYVNATSTTVDSTFVRFTATNATTTNATSTNFFATNASTTNATSTNLFSTLGRFTNSIVDTLLTAVSATITNLTTNTITATNATTTQLDAYNYIAVGRTATTTIRGDGVASTIPYASTTALTVSGTAYFPGSGIWNSSGNVGIGTASPGSAIDFGTSQANARKIISLYHSGNRYSGIGQHSSDASPVIFGSSSDGFDVIFGNLSVADGATFSTHAVITNSGLVGIGNTSPTYKLDVSGLGHFTGLVDAANFVATSTSATTTLAGGLAIETSGLVYDYSTNNVGIGTASPDVKLNVVGTIKFGSASEGRLISDGTNAYLDAFKSGGSLIFRTNIDNEYMRIASGGLVGIGSTTPWAKLSVTNSGSGPSFVVEDSTSPDSSPFIIDAGGAVGIGKIPASGYKLEVKGTGNTNATYAALFSNSDDASLLAIDNSGNTGLYTVSPWTRLSVNGGFGANASSTIGNGTQAGGLTISGGATTTGNAYFAGNVGIGTTSPATTLSVAGNGYLTGGLGVGKVNTTAGTVSATANISNGTPIASFLNPYGPASPVSVLSLGGGANSDSGGPYVSWQVGDGSEVLRTAALRRGGVWGFEVLDTSNNSKFVVNTSGNVGIGTTSPPYKLVVDNAGSAGIVAGFENSSGECTINPTGSSVNCSSDATMKTDVNAIATSTALSGVLALQPVFFNWLTEATGTPQHSGFIAQQVQPIFPDLVSSGSNGKLLLNYAGFVPYLTGALQQLYAMIEGLGAKIAAILSHQSQQDAKIQQLEQRVSSLESQMGASAAANPSQPQSPPPSQSAAQEPAQQQNKPSADATTTKAASSTDSAPSAEVAAPPEPAQTEQPASSEPHAEPAPETPPATVTPPPAEAPTAQ